MGKTITPKNKLARRFGVNLGLKTNPTKVSRRLSQPPGVHGPKKRAGASSSYGKQLLEKQKAKIIYGLREKQFRKYVEEVSKREGDSGFNLQKMLEMRLDNVVYRLGFADTRAQARQFVGHNMFQVNGKKMNIPSYIVKVGDEISLKANKQKKKLFETITDKLSKANVASWLAVDAVKKSGKVLGEPKDMDFDKIFDVKLIIEFYSAR
ncbi:MAG: 30S ribosomal protein S4 [Candidatus Magasanikiibacteriota bacterium]